MVEIFRAEGVEVDMPTFRRAELAARRKLHERIDEGNSGTEPELWQDYFAELYDRSGVPERTVAGVSDRSRKAHAEEHLWTYALPETGGALESLKAAGYRLGVISNADGRMDGALVRAGVRKHFEFVIDSGVIGVEKPDAEIFHAGCEAMDLRPAECLYVGDLFPVDYLGATAAGLGAVLLDPLEIHGTRAVTVKELREVEGWLATPA
jgi:putative hydrolase of the HAD superfamily